MGLPCLSVRARKRTRPPLRLNRCAPAKGRRKVVEYSGEGPKRDFPINTLGSRLPFGCRGRTWCQLYGGRWRMPGSILCYRQFFAATEPALGPVSTMSRPLWGNQNNRRGSDPSFVSGRKRQEQSPLLWWFRVTGWWQPHVSSLGSGRATAMERISWSSLSCTPRPSGNMRSDTP